MSNLIILASLAIATLYSAVPVLGHGYVILPPSRQARCRNGEVPGCGDVRYEPQSVEGLQGSFLCNGGGHRFHELNDEALWVDHFFVVPPGVESLPFTWELPAPHRTRIWEYFVLTENNALLLSEPGFNNTPVSPVTQLVPLNGITGKQTILARWSIGDTPNAFYSCVDLLIERSETATAVSGAAATQLPVAMPLGLPDALGHETTVNGSGTGTAESSRSVHKPLQNLLYIQGPQS